MPQWAVLILIPVETHMLELMDRFVAYYRRFGLFATVRRGAEWIRESVSNRDAVLFYCDLQAGLAIHGGPSGGFSVERKECPSDISTGDMERMLDHWNRDLKVRQIRDRFQRDATAWFVKKDGQLAGYGWTLTGATMEPHFFPVAENDVHLFDFIVFPEFRGQGANPVLVNRILAVVASEGRTRAFIESALRNEAQLRSLNKTPFRKLGIAKKTSCFKWVFVAWDKAGADSDKVCGASQAPVTIVV